MSDTYTSFYDLTLRVTEQGTAAVQASQKEMRAAVAEGEKSWQKSQETAVKAATTVATTATKTSTTVVKAKREESDAIAKAAKAAKDAMVALAKEWDDTAKAATDADALIQKSTSETAAAVDTATQKEIASLRATGRTYEEIAEMAVKGNALRAKSASDTAAAISLAAKQEADAIKAQGDAEAKRVGLATKARRTLLPSALRGAAPEEQAPGRVRSALGSVASGAGTVARGVGTVALGGLAVGAGLTIEGLRKSKELTEQTVSLRTSTGLSTKDALALSTIGSATGVNSSSIGMAFNTLGGTLTKAEAGGKTQQEGFEKLGISHTEADKYKNNLPGLFDLVTKRASTLPSAERAAVQKQFLGRGTRIAGQLEAAGPLQGQIKEVGKELGPVDPKTLQHMQESFIKLKETTTGLELAFAQAFGPLLVKLLKSVTPLIKPLGVLLTVAIGGGIKLIGELIKGPVGQALGKFAQEAVKAGGALLKAFAPALPFLKNVLLPVLKGIAEGVGIAIIGAMKLATPIVKVLAEGLGELGTILEPFKAVFEDIGKVIGIVFSGDILGAIGSIGKAADVIPVLGKVLSPIGEAVGVVGSAFSKAFEIAGGAVRALVGIVGGAGPAILGGIESAFNAVFGFMTSLPSKFLDFGKGIIEGIVHGVESFAPEVLKAIESIPGVGAVVKAGKSVAELVGLGSGGKLPGHAGGGWVPGSPHEDGTLAMLSGNEFVLTGDGQSMLDAHAPGLLDHIAASQMPHFRTGGSLGWTPKASGGSSKPEKVKSYLVGTEEVHETPAQHAARSLKERKEKAEGKAEGTGRWVRTGATIDPTQGQAPTYSAHGGMSFAELLEAGANAGVRPDLTQLLGLPRAKYGMAMETAIYARAVGGKNSFQIFKNDVGSGQAGDSHYTVDLHQAIANKLGFHGKGDIEVSTGKGGSSTDAAKVPELSNPALMPGESFDTGFEAGLKGEGIKTTMEAAIAAAKTSLSSSASGSSTGGGESQQTVESMFKAAQSIIGKPYVFGGGHGGFNSSGYDCSGAVSYVLHGGGLLSSPMTTDGLKTWGQPGQGANITVGVRGSTGSNAHTMIKFGNHYLESGGGGPEGKHNVHWDKTWDGVFTTMRHPGGEGAGGSGSSAGSSGGSSGSSGTSAASKAVRAVPTPKPARGKAEVNAEIERARREERTKARVNAEIERAREREQPKPIYSKSPGAGKFRRGGPVRRFRSGGPVGGRASEHHGYHKFVEYMGRQKLAGYPSKPGQMIGGGQWSNAVQGYLGKGQNSLPAWAMGGQEGPGDWWGKWNRGETYRRGGGLPGFRAGGDVQSPLVDPAFAWLNGAPPQLLDPRSSAFVGYGLRGGGWADHRLPSQRHKARSQRHAASSSSRAVARGLNDVGAIGALGDEEQVDAQLEDLAKTLEGAKKLTLDQLKRFAQAVRKATTKAQKGGATAIEMRRLQSALDVVEGVIGNRVGREVKALEEAGAALTAGVSGKGTPVRGGHQQVVALDANGKPQIVSLGGGRSSYANLGSAAQRSKAVIGYRVEQERRGVAAGSEAGLGADILSDKTAVPQMEAQLAALNTARKRAQAAHAPKAIAAIEAQMNTLQETITDTVTDSIVKQQELLMASAQKTVTNATHSQSMAQGRTSILEAQSALTPENSDAMRSQAAQLIADVLPSQQSVLGALRSQEGTLAGLAGAGNTSAADALAGVQEQIQQQQLAILQTQNQAAEKLLAAAKAQIEAAQRQQQLAQGREQLLEARQIHEGKVNTPGAFQAQAANITGSVVPAEQAVLAYLKSYQGVAKGDTAGYEKRREEIQQQELAILNSQNEAAERLLDAAKALAAPATATLGLGKAQYEHLKLSEELNYTTATSGPANAEFIQKTLIPEAQKALEANDTRRKAEEEKEPENEAKRIEDQTQREEEQNELLRLGVEAQNAIKDNTTKMVDASGTLGFSFQGQGMTDLINVGVGA